jgi:RNA polymerase sigma-70 factor (ECF subfamily)
MDPGTRGSGDSFAAGRFRRRTTLDDSDPCRLVPNAVAAARKGDRDALRFLYIRFADNIYGYVCSIIRDEHEAEDLTQQLFAKLPSALPKYQEREVPFSAWILRVARNLAVDHLRAQRAVPCAEINGASDSFDDESQERSRCLQDALNMLPDDQREVLIMRHIMGMSPGEIARSLGKSEGSIHGLHHRGRGAMQRALTKLDMAPATTRAAAKQR